MGFFIENEEEITKYGENICTEFGWITLKKQKENAERLENITKKDKS